MDKVSVTLTVFFEDPFWVGLFERYFQKELSVCKVVFGEEPKDQEIYAYVLKRYHLLKFSPAVKIMKQEKRINPKRQQREIHKLMHQRGISTKSQQALKLQYEQMKNEKKKQNKAQKDTLKKTHFELLQQKHKEKHRGR